ncbi:MAG: tetratricopeptide repeat protein [Paramuribaculum sp.]|nr:tetratricopeptide repeat protein [Paramuribaculum sp.]MDE6459824.1 tetratricopeptide repeat protein [Paramuribaculum sp.]
MKHIISFIVLVSICFSGNALTLDQRADSAYAADDFSLAASLYEEIMQSEGSSSELYYNLGNCWYRLDKPGKAIVAYERALRLDPSNKNALINLEFVNGKIFDRQGERGSFLSNAYDRAATLMTSNSWAITALIIFIALLGCIALYVFAPGIKMRKLGFFGGIVLLFATIISSVLAVHGANISSTNRFAIITSPSTLLSTSPREPKDRNEEAMLLHEGTKVEILDSISVQNDTTGLKWFDVQVDNTHRAWIKSSDVERI